MGTDKRARQKAGRQERIEAAQAAQKRAESRGRIVRAAVFVAVIAVLILTFTFFQNRNKNDSTDTASNPTTSAPAASATTSVSLPAVPDGAAVTGDTPCPAADGSSARTTKFEKAPPMCIDPAKTYTAKMSTTKGDLTIALDPKSAPLAANNFVVLSRYHYFDGIPFHRIIPDFVVQGGDPTAAGSGGPGYSFADELPTSADLYQPGTLAMANSGANTNGSQFFIVLSTGKLEAKYSIFGKVSEGFDTTVKGIAAVGTPAGTPSEVVKINSVTITES